jgi:predicted DNA-binding transcriptional regulator AlpA
VRLINADEVANKLGVKPSWVHERTRLRCPEAERIPCVRLGKYVRFVEADVEAWIARGCRT